MFFEFLIYVFILWYVVRELDIKEVRKGEGFGVRPVYRAFEVSVRYIHVAIYDRRNGLDQDQDGSSSVGEGGGINH